jgi:hypothetical protein
MAQATEDLSTALTPDSRNAAFPFLNLPAELCLMIVRMVLRRRRYCSQRKEYTSWITFQYDSVHKSLTRYGKVNTSILYTSKAVYSLCRMVLYGENVFTLSVDKWITGLANQSFSTDFLTPIGQSNVSHLKALNIQSDISCHNDNYMDKATSKPPGRQLALRDLFANHAGLRGLMSLTIEVRLLQARSVEQLRCQKERAELLANWKHLQGCGSTFAFYMKCLQGIISRDRKLVHSAIRSINQCQIDSSAFQAFAVARESCPNLNFIYESGSSIVYQLIFSATPLQTEYPSQDSSHDHNTDQLCEPSTVREAFAMICTLTNIWQSSGPISIEIDYEARTIKRSRACKNTIRGRGQPSSFLKSFKEESEDGTGD